MSADPVAIIELPNRVPYGFHALFVSEVSFKVTIANLVVKMWNYRINSCMWICSCNGFLAILSWLWDGDWYGFKMAYLTIFCLRTVGPCDIIQGLLNFGCYFIWVFEWNLSISYVIWHVEAHLYGCVCAPDGILGFHL